LDRPLIVVQQSYFVSGRNCRSVIILEKPEILLPDHVPTIYWVKAAPIETKHPPERERERERESIISRRPSEYKQQTVPTIISKRNIL
jgi:hypothetical protein